MKRPIDLIIFDLDGTLLDARKDIADAANYALRSLGLKEKNIAEISSYIGSGVDDLIKKSLGEDNQALFKEAVDKFKRYYLDHCAEKSHLYPHVRETLEYFKKKIMAIATNRNYDSANCVLKAFGIAKYFESIIGGDDALCRKPASCPLDATIKRFGAEKKRSVMVGDMDIDIMAGKKTKILTCGVTYGIGKRKDVLKARPDFFINDIAELKDIIY